MPEEATEVVEPEVVEGAEPVESTEPEFTLPEDFAEQAKGWGVKPDEIAQAVAMHKALQTEDGVVDAFIRTGQSLGFGIKELNRLFADDEPVAPAAAAPEAPAVDPLLEDPERLLTAREVSDLLAKERSSVDERLTASETQRQAEAFQARQAQTFAAMDQWFESSGVKDQAEKNFIAQLGEKTILPGADSYDPAVAIAALERGKAQYDAFVEKQAQAYIAKKGGTLAAQPTAIGGGGIVGGENEDAVDYAKLGSKALSTAKERVRARLREAGEMG